MSEFVTIFSFAFMGVAAGLLAWRWYLDARADESALQRAHELALRKEAVEFDVAALADDRAKLKRLEERVKTLEYRPVKA